MADYTSVALVESRIQGYTATATSSPSESEVEGFIIAIEAEMNATVKGLGFNVPITQATSPGSFAQLRDIATWGAAAMTLDALKSFSSSEEDERVRRWQKTYETRMSAIVSNGGDLLYDAVRQVSPVVNTAPVVSHPGSIEGSMTFRQLTRHRQRYNEDRTGPFTGWGKSKG